MWPTWMKSAHMGTNTAFAKRRARSPSPATEPTTVLTAAQPSLTQETASASAAGANPICLKNVSERSLPTTMSQ